MNLNNLSRTQKLTVSAMVMAMYVVIMYLTQSFAFGAYQIRIATSLYALSYSCPFLIVPLGLANMISNVLCGGLGPMDMIGGGIAGILTAGMIALIRKLDLNRLLIVPAITFIPGLLVPIWLSYLLNLPYLPLATSLCVGQAVCGVVGYLMIQALEKTVFHSKTNKVRI